MTKGNEKTYADREIDEKFESVHDRFDTQDASLARILLQTTATNGKVRKLIIAVFLIIGFAIGVSGKELLPILIKLAI